MALDLGKVPHSEDIKAFRINNDNVIEITYDNITWQATGSSGHLILDKDGNLLPQRSRLKFTNSVVTDVDGVTVVNGIKGDKGDTGLTGPQGIQGIQGVKGDTGNSIIPSVDQNTGLMSFTEGPAGVLPQPVYVRGPQGAQGVQGQQGIQGVAGNTGPAGPAGPEGPRGLTGPQGPKGDTGATGPQGEAGPRGLKGDTGDKGDKGDTGLTGATGATGPQGPTGPQGLKGDKGADGTSFAILGIYATLYDLQVAHPNGNPGDAYAVGTQISNVIYNWDVAQATWVNLGGLQGPQGPQGIQGIQGEPGPTGPAGATGETGATGPQGPKGDTGKGYFPQSTWASGREYLATDSQIDVVLYNGSSYYCKQTHTSGTIIPTDTAYWGILANKGADGLTTSVNNVEQVNGNVSLDGTDIPYSNTVSGLVATETQGAIDELATEKMELDGSNSSVANLTFKTDTSYAPGTGEIGWNATEKTLDVGLAGTTVLQLGQELYRPLVINQSGSTIENGMVVMYDGAVGASGQMKVKAAIGDGSIPFDRVLGISTQEILNGATGYITLFGKIRGINTSGSAVSETWADGDILYLHPTSAGKMTKTKPSAPNLKVVVARVINAHAVNGAIDVNSPVGSELGGTDSNVEITSPINGNALVYNSTTGRWENKTLSASDVGAAIKPTNEATATNGQVLTSNGDGTATFKAAAEVIKNKYDATAAPTKTDDANAGYAVGSVWIDVTNDIYYRCVDATASAAVWQSYTVSTSTGIKRYGFRRERGASDPTARITYLYDAVGLSPASMNFGTGNFDYGGWQTFINEVSRPVMLKTDGTVDYELSRTDMTKKSDGVTASDVSNTAYAGNAMIEFRKYKWVYRYSDATYDYVIFSDGQYDSNYKAYAHTNANGTVKDAFYWGAFKGSNISSKLRSFADQTVMVSQTRNTEVSYANAVGSGYHTIYKSGWDFICDLLTLVSKSDDSQTKFGTGRSKTTNTTAIATGTLKAQPQFKGYNDETSDVKVFGIEGFWGNVWEGMAGLILNSGIKTKMTPPYNFDGTGYTATGITPSGTNGGYVSVAQSITDQGYVPSVASGSSSTYFCDGLWYNNSQVDYAIVGGYWGYGLLDGSRYVGLADLASVTYTIIGSRLSYLNPA